MSEKADDKAIKLLMNAINKMDKKKKDKDKGDDEPADIKIRMLGDTDMLNIPVIPSGSLALDMALGIGGYPQGRIIEVLGPESSGKSTLALTAIAQAQKIGLQCAYIDVEGTLDIAYAKTLGVDVDRLMLAQPDDGDEAMRIVDRLINSNLVGLIVLDSVASLIRTSEREGEATDNSMGVQARLMSSTLKRFTMPCHKTGTTLFLTNQLRMKIGVMYGNPETTSGGNALKYYASIRMDIRRGESIKDGDEFLGAETKVKIIKNKCAVPFKIAHFNIMYGKGIDKEADVINTAMNLGVIEQAGATYSFAGEKIAVGKDKAIAALMENPTLLQTIRETTLKKLETPVSGIPETKEE